MHVSSTYALAQLCQVAKIRSMSSHLDQQRRPYIGADEHSSGGSLSEQEREELDAQWKSFIELCTKQVESLKELLGKHYLFLSPSSPHITLLDQQRQDLTRMDFEHRQIVVFCMLALLQELSAKHEEFRYLRSRITAQRQST